MSLNLRENCGSHNVSNASNVCTGQIPIVTPQTTTKNPTILANGGPIVLSEGNTHKRGQNSNTKAA